MYRKDQIKGALAIVLFAAIGITFFIFGKESDITRTVAVIGLMIWLGAMFVLNRKFKD